MSSAAAQMRTADIDRKTKETEVTLAVDLDGAGKCKIDSGVGFLDHMLELFARHGKFDLNVVAKGDLETGAHHTVEDVGIVLGQAFDQALGDRSGITRYGSSSLPMDESLARCAIDVSGRPLCVFDPQLPAGTVGGFDTELTEEFYRAFATNAKLTLHISVTTGSNVHHMVEATFKAFARALRQAVSIDPTEVGVPSTKGVI